LLHIYWNICVGVFSGTWKKWLGHSSLWDWAPSNHQEAWIPDTAMKAGMQNVTRHKNTLGGGGYVKAREGERTTKLIDEFRYFGFRIASLNLLNTCH